MPMSPTLLRPRRRAAVPPPPVEGSAPSAPTGISLTTAPFVPTALTLTTAPSPPLTPSLATTPDSPTGVTVETGLVAPTNVGLLAAPKNLTATEIFAPDSPTGLDLTSVPASPTGVQLFVVPSEPTSVTVASVPSSPTGVGLLGEPSNLVVTEDSAPDSPTSVQLTTSPTVPTNPQLTTAPSSPTGVTAIGAAATDPYFSDVTLLLAMDGTNGSTAFVDDSNSSLSFTAFGAAQITTAESKFGGASGLFDGTGDYIESDTTTGALQFGTGDFTVEAWVYLDSTASEGVIQQTPTTAPSFYCSIDSTAVRVGRHGSGQYSGASNTLSTGTWHHVAWVRASGTIYIFFDGVSQSVSDTSGGVGSFDYSAERTVVVGRAGALDFDGNIDSLRVTKAARYTANFTPPTSAFPATNGDPYFSDVALLLAMDGANGSPTFIDDSLNAATVIANGDAQLSTAQSKFGGSSYLGDGNGDYLSVSGDLRLTGDFTVETWVYPTTTSGARWIINIGSETTGRFLFGILNGNLAIDRSGVATNSFTNGSVSTNQWSHVAITREGSDLRAFINGTLLQTISISGTLGNANQFLRVGMSNSASQAFLGHIDDLRITTGVARYTTSFTPPTSAFPN